MADPAILGQLVIECNAFTLATFGPFNECAPTGLFTRLLEKTPSPGKLLEFFKDYWNGVASLGYSPFKINIQMHDGNMSCERYIEGRLEGKYRQSPVAETPDSRKEQILHVEAMLRMKLAEEKSITNPSYDPNGIELCYKMLAALATRPLFVQAA